MTRQDAVARGLTREVFASSHAHDLHLLVAPDADLDGAFEGFCLYEHELLTVNGWNYTVEDYEE